MTQPTETLDDGIEPDFFAMVALMVAAEGAEVKDLPIEGLVIPFPSPFA